MSAAIPFNPIAAECTIMPCLWQVAGHINGDPAAQLSACQSIFGFPVVQTVTLPAEDIFSTRTSTTTDVVVVITTSTAYATAEETSTALETAESTITEYTTTVTSTVLTTVSAPAPTVTVVKRGSGSHKLKRRGGCKPKTTTTSESSTGTNEPASSTTASMETDEPTSTSPADVCADPSVYSSACACLEASPATVYVSAATSIIDEATTVTSFSTEGAAITVTVTDLDTVSGTTTLLSTLSTVTTVTTTVTATASPAPVAPTSFGLVLADGSNVGKSLVISGSALAYVFVWANGVGPRTLGLPAAGGQPFVENSDTYKMYVRLSTTSYGVVFFTTPAYVASSAFTWAPVSCSVDAETLVMSCSTPNLMRFLQCGSTIYMANANTTPGGCVEVHLKVPSSV